MGTVRLGGTTSSLSVTPHNSLRVERRGRNATLRRSPAGQARSFHPRWAAQDSNPAQNSLCSFLRDRPETLNLVITCPVQNLGLVGAGGIEPPTPSLSVTCSTTELRTQIFMRGHFANYCSMLTKNIGIVKPMCFGLPRTCRGFGNENVTRMGTPTN